MCQKESRGAIVAPKEAHSTQRGQVQPTTENARAWVVEVHVRAKGTKSNPCSNERSELRSLVPGVGEQSIRLWLHPFVLFRFVSGRISAFKQTYCIIRSKLYTEEDLRLIRVISFRQTDHALQVF